jgi:hypothetical protein
VHRELGLDEDVGRRAFPGLALAEEAAVLAVEVERGRADAGRAVVVAGLDGLTGRPRPVQRGGMRSTWPG